MNTEQASPYVNDDTSPSDTAVMCMRIDGDITIQIFAERTAGSLVGSERTYLVIVVKIAAD
jgi:hypothetical protein